MKRNKKKRGLTVRNAITGYLFISPFILGFAFFMVNPLINSLRMSLSTVIFNESGYRMEFAALANYIKALTVDSEFNRMLTTELFGMLGKMPFVIILSFFIALMLNQKFKLRGVARSIFFLPVILSSGVIVGLEYDNSLLNSVKDVILENSNTGAITDMLEELLLSSFGDYAIIQVVLDAINGIYDIVMISGIQILIFLSGLQSIPGSMYEASKIEGATAWENFWKITLPMISSLILVNLVYTVSDICLRSNSELLTKIRSAMVQNMDFGFSSAMGWIYFLTIMLVILVVVGLLSKVVFYDE